jgi:putative transposase
MQKTVEPTAGRASGGSFELKAFAWAKQRVQRLMQQHGIRARGKRRFRVTTTDSGHNLPIAPNLLNRNFTPGAPNQTWAGDITYIATEEGWLFLAVVIDLFSRRVVGWSMQPDMRRNLVNLKPLSALLRRTGCPP